MFNRQFTLRAILAASFVAATVLPLLTGAYFAISSLSGAVRSEAQDKLELHMGVAQAEWAESAQDLETALMNQAKGTTIADAATPSIRATLANQARALNLTALMLVRADRVVVASSLGVRGYKTELGVPNMNEALRTGSAMGIIPDSELKTLGISDALAITPKVTKGGTIKPGEENGALSRVIWSPTADREGALVAVYSFKKNNALVDAVTRKVGGTCTVFQHGVRIATTVKDDEGKRAISTVISDKVRAVTLATGEPFRGEAIVVNQQYLTAYDPIKDAAGKTVGILYVGVPLKPYTDKVSGVARAAVVFIVIVTVLAVVLALFISRSITTPLNELNTVAAQVAGGDLTSTVPERGYLEARGMGKTFNTMTSALRMLVARVSGSSDRLATVSSTITHASTISAEAAARQASSVAQTTATLEELTRTFGAVADGANRVMTIAEDSLEAAQQGSMALDDTNHTISDLAHGSANVRASAEEMSVVAEDIFGLTRIITSIAEQTKILAMNAAIEAARAGDAGRGFTVVAGEIRSLAESVSASAARISESVTGIQVAVDGLNQTAQSQADLAAAGVDKSRRTSDAFGNILEHMAETAAAAREIATSAAQQKSAASQMVSVMQELSSGSSETASAARELADSARQVTSEAEDMRRGLSDFRV